MVQLDIAGLSMPGEDFLGMTPGETLAIMGPNLVEEISDLIRWRGLVFPVYRRVVKDAVRRFLVGRFDPVYQRTEAQVVEGHSEKWMARSLAANAPTGAIMPMTWAGRHLIIDSRGIRRLYIARIMRLIDQLCPRRVLDVGCGNGEKLLILACRFPDIEFHGIDITPSGIVAAKDVQKMARLPDWLVEFSPEPLRDLAAHRAVHFQEGSAKEMPYADGSMDLVYTSLSIEQMQSIKDEVLAEVGRVSGAYASFFEAFRDFNRGFIQRLYIYAENYFRGEIREVYEVGFHKISCFTSLPQKLWMNNVHVLASK